MSGQFRSSGRHAALVLWSYFITRRRVVHSRIDDSDASEQSAFRIILQFSFIEPLQPNSPYRQLTAFAAGFFLRHFRAFRRHFILYSPISLSAAAGEPPSVFHALAVFFIFNISLRSLLRQFTPFILLHFRFALYFFEKPLPVSTAFAGVRQLNRFLHRHAFGDIHFSFQYAAEVARPPVRRPPAEMPGFPPYGICATADTVLRFHCRSCSSPVSTLALQPRFFRQVRLQLS